MQSDLPKLIEGCEVTLPASGKMQGLASTLISMNTKDILFICGGAFSGLLTASKQGNPIGFHTTDSDKFSEAKKILITLDDLDEDDLVRILTEPDDSITKEYQMLFKKDGIDLLFDDDALHEIARPAFENGTGARGLRTILEDVLMDIMYGSQIWKILPNVELQRTQSQRKSLFGSRSRIQSCALIMFKAEISIE